MTVSLQLDATDLIAKARDFKRLAEGMPRAIREGLNEGGDKVRTDVRKALQVQTGAIAYRTITSRTRSLKAGAAGARVQDMQYVIFGSGKGLPIKLFRVSAKRGAGGGVTGYPWAVEHKFKRSFIGTGKIAGQLRARLPGGRQTIYVPGGMYGVMPVRSNPTRALFGPSIPKEMMQGSIPSVFMLSAGAQVLPAIEKRILRLVR